MSNHAHEPIHMAEMDTPMRDGYTYSSTGVGVRDDLVQAVLAAWAAASPYSGPAQPLKSVNDSHLNSVDNLARMAAAAVAQTIVATKENSDA